MEAAASSIHNNDQTDTDSLSASNAATESPSHDGWGHTQAPSNLPKDVVFREVTSDTNVSISIIGKRIIRQYCSEFILPDDTQVSISRHEYTKPSDGQETVTLSLSVAIRLNDQPCLKTMSDSARVKTLNTNYVKFRGLPDRRLDKKFIKKYFDMDDEKYGKQTSDEDEKAILTDSTTDYCSSSSSLECRHWTKRPRGLQIADYMHDDPWAATILIGDPSVSGDLLRQLETGCRLEPDAYRLERIQRKRNWETIIDVHNQPTVRSIGLSRAQSETDSIATVLTNVELDDDLENDS